MTRLEQDLMEYLDTRAAIANAAIAEVGKAGAHEAVAELRFIDAVRAIMDGQPLPARGGRVTLADQLCEAVQRWLAREADRINRGDHAGMSTISITIQNPQDEDGQLYLDCSIEERTYGTVEGGVIPGLRLKP